MFRLLLLVCSFLFVGCVTAAKPVEPAKAADCKTVVNQYMQTAERQGLELVGQKEAFAGLEFVFTSKDKANLYHVVITVFPGVRAKLMTAGWKLDASCHDSVGRLDVFILRKVMQGEKA